MRILLSGFLFILITNLTLGQSQKFGLIDSTLVDSAKTMYRAGQYAEAIAIWETIIQKELLQKDSFDISLAECYHQIALNYFVSGNDTRCIPYANLAKTIRIKYYGGIHEDIGRSALIIGSAYRDLLKLDKAKENLDEAVFHFKSLVEKTPDDIRNKKRLTNALQGLSGLHVNLGDYTTALEYGQEVINQFNHLFDLSGDTRYQSSGYHQIVDNASALMLLKQYDEAAEQLETVIAYREKGKQKNLLELARIKTNLAGLYLDKKSYAQAIAPANEALEILKKIITPDDNVLEQSRLAKSYSIHAYATGMSGKNTLFKESIDKAIQIGTKIHNTEIHPNLASTYASYAEVAILQKDYLKAHQFQDKAIRCLDVFQKESYVISIKRNSISDKRKLFEYLIKKAELLEQEYIDPEVLQKEDDLHKMLHNYLQIDSLTTQMGQGYQNAASRLFLLSNLIGNYEKAIRTALRLYEREQDSYFQELAFYFNSKNKALLLLEDRTDEQAKKIAGIPPNLLEKEKSLKRANYKLESAIQANQSNGNLERAEEKRSELFAIRQEQIELKTLFESEYPVYYNLKYNFSTPIAITDLQNSLPANTLLLEYFIGNEQLFIFAISQATFKIHTLPLPSSFRDHCEHYRTLISNNQEYDETKFNQISHQLYEWLLSEAFAGAPAGIDRLIIVPDDVLLHLSFDALSKEEAAGNYLIKDYAISYLYSSKFLSQEQSAISFNGEGKGFGGFGIEYDDFTLSGMPAINQSSMERSRGNWESLPFASSEVKQATAIFNGTSWLNEEAVKTTFLKKADRFQILHLAMHGLVNEEYPLGSALVFSRTQDSLDNFLDAGEIYGLELKADLAVLSACNTGYGKIEKGEGIRSLARAFAYAGCNSLLASLWPASDQSTQQIILDFYKNLQAGQSKDKALQMAKLQYLESAPQAFKVPVYWAHLNVLGANSPITVVSKMSSFYLYLIGVGIGLLLAIIAVLVKMRKKTGASVA